MSQRRKFLGTLAAAGAGLVLPGCGGGGGEGGDVLTSVLSNVRRLPVVPDTGANGSLGRVVVVGGGHVWRVHGQVFAVVGWHWCWCHIG